MAITSDSTGKHDSAAPPSYAAAVAGHGPSSQRPAQQPQAVTRAYSLPGDEQTHLNQAQVPGAHPPYQVSGGNAEAQWVPASSEREVKSRARKRFFIAFLWAFSIWTLLGMFIGGTVEDARDQARHRRHSGRHNPGRPIDDAPPMGSYPRPTRTWHKITPMPMPTPSTDSVLVEELPRLDLGQEVMHVGRKTEVDELD